MAERESIAERLRREFGERGHRPSVSEEVEALRRLVDQWKPRLADGIAEVDRREQMGVVLPYELPEDASLVERADAEALLEFVGQIERLEQGVTAAEQKIVLLTKDNGKTKPKPRPGGGGV